MNDLLKQFYKKNSSELDRPLDQDRQAQIKTKLFSNMQNVSQDAIVGRASFWKSWYYNRYAIGTLSIILFLSGTTYVSADAIPGETLYGLKRGIESASVTLLPQGEFRQNMEDNFAQRRIKEFEQFEHKYRREITELHTNPKAFQSNSSSQNKAKLLEKIKLRSEKDLLKLQEKAQKESENAKQRLYKKGRLQPIDNNLQIQSLIEDDSSNQKSDQSTSQSTDSGEDEWFNESEESFQSNEHENDREDNSGPGSANSGSREED